MSICCPSPCVMKRCLSAGYFCLFTHSCDSLLLYKVYNLLCYILGRRVFLVFSQQSFLSLLVPTLLLQHEVGAAYSVLWFCTPTAFAALPPVSSFQVFRFKTSRFGPHTCPNQSAQFHLVIIHRLQIAS